MTTDIVACAVEQRNIHNAVCRARRQGLVCSTCTQLSERAARAVAARGWGTCPCGGEDWLIGGLCEPCRVVKAA